MDSHFLNFLAYLPFDVFVSGFTGLKLDQDSLGGEVPSEEFRKLAWKVDHSAESIVASSRA